MQLGVQNSLDVNYGEKGVAKRLRRARNSESVVMQKILLVREKKEIDASSQHKLATTRALINSFGINHAKSKT